MQIRGEILIWLFLLGACGGEAEPPVAIQPAPKAPSEPQAAAPAVEPPAQAPPAADDAWLTWQRSEIVAELPPPEDAGFLERAAEDRQRLEEILDKDLRSQRARVRTLQRRLSLKPNNPELRFQLAEFYYQSGLPNLAELELLNFLELQPQDPVAHKYLADIYLQSGSQGRAIYHARRAHHGNPDDASVLYLWGWTLRDGGDPAASLAVTEAGLAVDPQDADLLTLRALLAVDLGDDRAAEAFARRAVEANPDHLRAHSQLGLALSALGRYDEAEAELATHRRLQILHSAKLLYANPPLSESERAAALCAYHMHVGNLDHAYEELARSLALEPDNPSGLTMRARLLVKEGDEAQALSVLEDALAKHPGDHRVERALASVLATASDPALRDHERAMELASGLLGRGGSKDFEVLYTLGVSAAALGYESQARTHLRAALKIEAGNPNAEAALAALDAK